jgi:hypothetical protein
LMSPFVSQSNASRQMLHRPRFFCIVCGPATGKTASRILSVVTEEGRDTSVILSLSIAPATARSDLVTLVSISSTVADVDALVTGAESAPPPGGLERRASLASQGEAIEDVRGDFMDVENGDRGVSGKSSGFEVDKGVQARRGDLRYRASLSTPPTSLLSDISLRHLAHRFDPQRA